MIDTHCHILPGVDDGCQTLEDSVELAREMVKQGIQHALCTPHHQNGRYQNNATSIIPQVERLQQELKRQNIPLAVYEGQEIRLYPDLLLDLERREILGMDSESHYLLVEFPQHEIPFYAEKLMEKLIRRGHIPVIAHPERNLAILQKPEILEDLIQLGAITQLTAPSYLGLFGKRIQKFARTLLEHRLVYTVASDTHGNERRPCQLAQAYDAIANDFSPDLVERLQQNAKRMVNGEVVEMESVYRPWRKTLFGEWV